MSMQAWGFHSLFPAAAAALTSRVCEGRPRLVGRTSRWCAALPLSCRRRLWTSHQGAAWRPVCPPCRRHLQALQHGGPSHKGCHLHKRALSRVDCEAPGITGQLRLPQSVCASRPHVSKRPLHDPSTPNHAAACSAAAFHPASRTHPAWCAVPERRPGAGRGPQHHREQQLGTGAKLYRIHVRQAGQLAGGHRSMGRGSHRRAGLAWLRSEHRAVRPPPFSVSQVGLASH